MAKLKEPPNPVELPPPGVWWRARHVRFKYNWSAPTLLKRIREDGFPPPVVVGNAPGLWPPKLIAEWDAKVLREHAARQAQVAGAKRPVGRPKKIPSASAEA